RQHEHRPEGDENGDRQQQFHVIEKVTCRGSKGQVSSGGRRAYTWTVMNRSPLSRLVNTDLQNLLDRLSTRQHLRPHEPLADSLAHTVECMAVCPDAIEQAVSWLAIDPSIPIGR